MSPETKILWLPAADYESRSIFDYETNTFTAGTRNPAGVRIDANTALNSTIVLACVRVLAEGLATLPLHIYARSKNGGKELARSHPLYRVLHDRPNDWQTSFEWREMQMLHLGIYGQSFNEIVRDKRDVIRSLVPLHPSRMRVESIETGNLRYTYQEENGRLTVYPQDQVMHIRWMSNDGVNGMVPIELAKDAIGLARACEIHGASFFGNGARPGLVLSTENTLSVEAAESLRANWERVHRGPDRSNKTAVLTGGLKPVEFGNTNQESQFLETRRFQIEEICRLYRIPGSLVGDLSRSNFANIEQQSIDFIQFTMLPWLRRFESAFSRDLLDDDETHFAEFDTRGLMRGDAATRASYYSTLYNLGIASVNELRAWENLDPVEGGDARFAPLNMQTLAAAAKQGEDKDEPAPPTASVNELVAVLAQVASGSVAPESAKAIMAAAFPAMTPELAGQILAGVSGPPPEKSPDPQPERPTADVGGLVAILAQVKDGSLQAEAAVATMGSVYPELPPETAQQIVAGVNKPPQPPAPPEQPAADVAGLLAILGQVSQGAVTPEAAMSIVEAVFPTMPADMAKAIISGAKAQQPPPEAGPPGQEPPPDGGPPPEGEPPQSGPGDGSGEAARAFCPGASPPDNSCSPANKGDAQPYSSLPKAFPPGAQKLRDAIDSILPDAEAVWDRSKGRAETPPKKDMDGIADEQESQSGKPLTPEAEASYQSLVDEIGKQYESLVESGLKARAWRGEGEPYGDPPGSTKPNSDRMREEVAKSGEFSFFMTEKGFGTGDATPDHPMLRETKYKTADGEPMIANDLFRVVHDMVAHVRGGYSFSTNGEFNGMLTHASTMPESAWPALFAETFGQNAVYEKTGGYAQQNAYASKVGPRIIRDQLRRARASRSADHRDADSDEPLGYQHIKTRPWLVVNVEGRAFCPGASPPDNSCSPSNKGDGGNSAGRVSASKYGMDYSPKNAKVVAKAREVPDEQWNELPVKTISHGTKLKANEETLKTAPIEKVVSGQEPFREGYVTKLWDDGKGNLHIVDGHHRVAMYHALGKDMPARIMSQADYKRLSRKRSARAFCPGASPPDNSCSPANKGEGGKGTGSPDGGSQQDVLEEPRREKATAADVSAEALKSHADKVAGGSYVDGSLVTDEFPDGAIVPKDYAKLEAHHAEVKRQLAERIDVPTDTSANTKNAASTVAELLSDARDVVPAYRSLVEQAAKDSGTEASFGEADPNNPAHDYLREHAGGTHILKLPESLEGKVPRVRKEKEYDDSVPDSIIVSEELKDAVRGTLIADTPESLGDAVRSVQRQAEEQGLSATVKNVFAENWKTGYGAVHMTLQMQSSSGRPVMTELQFHLRQAYDGNRGSPKDNSHGLYKEDPKTERITPESTTAQMLIWSKAFDEVPPAPRRRRSKAADGEYRAFCPGSSPPDNSCSPANKGDGKSGGANKKGGGRVRNQGKTVRFGTVAKAALDNMRKTGGFSVHPITGDSPTTGFMVSVKPESEVIYDSYEQVNEAAFRDFYESNKAAFDENPNLHFGGWVDQNTGKVYFDLSARYEKITEAIDDAQKTNQLAIWHLDEGREIRKEDYARRRKQGRSQAVGSVRLSARGRRQPGLQGHGGCLSRVRQKGDGGQAQRQQVAKIWRGGSRAFCPGVSPPDNSCSPANKGTGKEPAPEPPEPAYDDTVITGREDPRGALTGHNRQQREDYQTQVVEWMEARGITVTVKDDGKGPPSVDALNAVAKGVEEAGRLGIEVPKEIFVQNTTANAFATFNVTTGSVSISPDLSLAAVRDAVEAGGVAGDLNNASALPLIHELSHRDHVASIDAAGRDGRVRFWDWTGRLAQTEDGVRPTINPWAPGMAARPTGISADDARQIAESVSRYAATNPVEFVAEVRTAMSGGRRFPRRTMKLYRDYLGPPTPANESPLAEAA